MTVTVAINGFGRIGRCVLRSLVESGHDDIRIVAINDLGSVETNAHILKYDSVHGPLKTDISTSESSLVVAGHKIEVSAERDPSKLQWGNADIALECTGIFIKREAAVQHLSNSSKKVLVSAPSPDADKTIVYGVNHDGLTGRDLVVSNPS